jgi:hypothetical protein
MDSMQLNKRLAVSYQMEERENFFPFPPKNISLYLQIMRFIRQ